jgi:4-carboxymuconolactone decarboxylase
MSAEVDRETAGLAVMERMFGPDLAVQIRDSIGATSPDFADYVVRAGFGDVYARPGLSLGQRNLLTISVLTTLGLERQLAIHIGAALEVGVEPTEILETIFHVALYAGHPRAVNGFRVAGEVFDQAGLTPDGGT